MPSSARNTPHLCSLALRVALLVLPQFVYATDEVKSVGIDLSVQADKNELWQQSIPSKPDWKGISRDTAYFMGWQFVSLAALYVSPQSVSSWDANDKSDITATKWNRNVTHPVWDQDDWSMNYILHPYWGATYYIRGRERGLSRTDSFLIATLWSVLFEYGGEALFEPVSKQDLIVTPVAGALIGEYWFVPWRENIRAKPNGPSSWDSVLLVMTDPFYYLNAWVDGVLGMHTDIRIQYTNMRMIRPGLSALQLPLSGSSAQMWSLRLHAVW